MKGHINIDFVVKYAIADIASYCQLLGHIHLNDPCNLIEIFSLFQQKKCINQTLPYCFDKGNALFKLWFIVSTKEMHYSKFGLLF